MVCSCCVITVSLMLSVCVLACSECMACMLLCKGGISISVSVAEFVDSIGSLQREFVCNVVTCSSHGGSRDVMHVSGESVPGT